jgi:gamma-glutamyltranspeptidase/glutathione hydrolase
MKKIIVLLCMLFRLYKNTTVEPTGLIANKAMVVSAREEASKLVLKS